MSEMTPELLEHLTAEEREMLERANAASEGPWDTVDHERECGGFGCTPNGCPGHLTGVAYNVDGPVLLVDGDADGDRYQYEQADKDAKFIAASRTDVPELLRRLSEARRALRELCVQVEKSNAVDDHGHPLKNLKALKDARVLLDAAAHAAKE